MMAFLSANFGTIIVLLVVAGLVAMVIAKLVKDKRKARQSGGASCGCGCASCPYSGGCEDAEGKSDERNA
ncbi:MAG: FeoB-associated Cys-rich membrane protein [Oscillospiraceae bacterium]|jgi:NADH:ubiquinone oxidoreductase subunit 3 (subunit A)|nr:FeoB-associated Cys-rich membrane protein [Oscillospiraceae bacterium]